MPEQKATADYYAMYIRERERVAELEAALAVAADDLDKAANQFEGLKQANEAGGHPWPVIQNPQIFADKATRARLALKGNDLEN